MLTFWLLACRSPEVPDDTSPPATTDTSTSTTDTDTDTWTTDTDTRTTWSATDDPPFTCSGVEVERLNWGTFVPEGSCVAYRRRDILDMFPPGPTCDTIWVNHGSYDVEGTVIGDECQVDQTLDDWCRENLPCWEDQPTCPHLADLLWMLGATDPASTYEWEGFGGSESTFDYIFHQCTDEEDQYFSIDLIGLNFEMRYFHLHSAPGVPLDDAELFYMGVTHDYYRLPQP